MASSQPRSFGDLLRRYRVAAGFTQEQLAERAGLSRRAIGALETGERLTPHKETVALLANALGLTSAERALLESTVRPRLPDTPRPRDPVGALSTPRPGSRRPSTPLVGRRQELRALTQHLDAGESPSLLVIAGEAGIGKSRLLEESIRIATEQHWTVLAGGCHRRSGQEPYVPFVSALSHFLDTRSVAQQRLDLQDCAWLVRLLPELADRTVTPAPSWTLPPEQERRLLFGAVVTFLGNIASPAGALLVLDDLHWAGSDTLDLLAALSREPPSRPLRIVAAYRDTEVAARDPLSLLLGDLMREGLATRISPPPLERNQAKELLVRLLSGEPAATREDERLAAVIDSVLDRASGLPFFLVSWAQELRVTMLSPDAARTTVPWSAAESIRQRVAVLPESAFRLLAIAAVAGHHISRKVLLAAAEASGQREADTLAMLDLICHARLVQETADGAYTFAHDLIRETLVADLTGARRVALHRLIADLLESQPHRERPEAELAWHFAEGDEPDRALPYALQAGDQAKEIYAHTDAEYHYRMAAHLAHTLGNPGIEADALERLGEVLYNQGRIADIPATLMAAAELRKGLGDLDQYVWDTANIIRADISQGQAARGLERMQAALASLDTHSDHENPAESPTTGHRIQSLHALSHEHLEALAAHAETMLSTRVAGRTYMVLAACLVHGERYEEAVLLGRHAVAYARTTGPGWMLSRAQRFLGRALEATGQVSQAAAAFEAGGAEGERCRDLEGVAFNYIDLAGIYLRRGMFGRALFHLKHALETAERFGVPEFIAQGASSLAQTWYYLGDWTQARAYCAHALEAMRVSDVLTESARPLYVLGILCLAQEDIQQAQKALDEARALSERAQNFSVLRAARAAPAERELLYGFPQVAYARLAPLLGETPRPGRHTGEVVDMIALLPLLAWATADIGAIDQAEQIALDAMTRATACAQDVVLVDALRIRGILSMRRDAWDEAAQALDEALSRSRAMSYPYAEAKSLYVYGQLHAARGEQEQARDRYRAALVILHQLGERLYAGRIERALVDGQC